MEKISSQLKDKMRIADPGSESKFKLIISLFENADWNEEVRLLQEAGLQLESTLKEIHTVIGRADRNAIQNMADISGVALIEIDASASTMDSDRLP